MMECDLGDNVKDAAVTGLDADHPMSALPGFTLRRAANAMMAELAGRLVALDLKISDASVLLLVGGRADMTSSDIGRLLDIQRANMVPLLNRLETAGLIMREPIDRKSQAIVLTPLGETRLEDVRATTARFEDDLMARIPAEHRGHFLPALNALLD
jgi:DNA-binding MarR family transcriptional regulator